MQILFQSFMGQAIACKALQGLVTQGIHRSGRTLVNKSPVLGEYIYVVLFGTHFRESSYSFITQS